MKPRPLSNTNEVGKQPYTLQVAGRSAEAPLIPAFGSSQEDVANHAYRIALARKSPVFFSFNRSVFRVEIIADVPQYSTVFIDSNSRDMIPTYLKTFQTWRDKQPR